MPEDFQASIGRGLRTDLDQRAALDQALKPSRLTDQRNRLVQWESGRRESRSGFTRGGLLWSRAWVPLAAAVMVIGVSAWLGSWLGPTPGAESGIGSGSDRVAGGLTPAEATGLNTGLNTGPQTLLNREGSQPSKLSDQLTARLNERRLERGDWFHTDQAGTRLSFSDGSGVEIAAQTRVRLTELDSQRVGFTLESGKLVAEVNPKGKHVWVFAAGPYQVVVLGTKLSIDWQPSDETLRVAVTRGKVRVDGAQLEGGRLVAAGESISISPPAESANQQHVEGRAIQPAQGSSTERSASGELAGQRRASDTPAKRATQEQRPSRAVGSRRNATRGQPLTPEARKPLEGGSATQPDWAGLARRGEFAQALAAANQLGFDTLMQRVDPSELLLLSDSARLGGSPAQSRRALIALRQRFPNHPNATVAAFTLGRIAHDMQGDPANAIGWFRKYLRSAPSGALAEGARGRMVRALSALGRKAEAQQAARAYLAHHPTGPYAPTARSLLADIGERP